MDNPKDTPQFKPEDFCDNCQSPMEIVERRREGFPINGSESLIIDIVKRKCKCCGQLKEVRKQVEDEKVT